METKTANQTANQNTTTKEGEQLRNAWSLVEHLPRRERQEIAVRALFLAVTGELLPLN